MKVSYPVLITIFILLSLFGKYYNKYIKKDEVQHDNDLIRKFLLNDDINSIQGKIFRKDKPIVWIHIPHEINARNWHNFGSRNNTNLNQPYLYLTIKSIIRQCGEEMNVCIVNDNSFSKLIPNWNIELCKIPDPVRCYIRTLGLYKLLYRYGGVLMPCSFLALSPLINMYNKYTSTKDCFIGTHISRNLTSERTITFVNHKMVGCKTHSPVIKRIIDNIEYMISTDYTHEQKIDGTLDKVCYREVYEGNMELIPAQRLGVVSNDNKPIYIDHLLSTSYIDFCDDLCGIMIPDEEILRRIKYQWFARMSIKQIYDSPIILCKYIQSSQLD